MPLSEVSHVTVREHVHIGDHPLSTVSVAVVPGAETTSFLWPEVNHFSDVIGWVRDSRSDSVRNSHEHEFTPVIAEVIVDPEQVELILQEDVMTAEESPVQELISCEWESSLE